ncbi:hypothetical protein AB2N08_08235 [Massilia aurea]|uniref:hypothetical protein n=1 Tax=Massilia aurea TaxID=373040 RepID=UPI0034623757
MHKLIAELLRLYLPFDALPPDVLALHLQGQQNAPVSLTGSDGLTRAMMIPFRKTKGADSEAHWMRLCEVANALQTTLSLPAPAVSISGGDAYYLWLSLETPVPAERAQAFLERLRTAYFPEVDLAPDAVRAPVALPPCLHPRTGRWAAFIHPGMGASFADEPGLDMRPPPNGQAGFLEGLESIDAEGFERVWRLLEPATVSAPVAASLDTPVVASVPASAPPAGLLLKDATLEDIVRHLHAKNIEPTFRHRMS